MIAKDVLELMARYNQWMNEKLYRVCAGIPDPNRKKDLGAFFKSVHGRSIMHLRRQSVEGSFRRQAVRHDRDRRRVAS